MRIEKIKCDCKAVEMIPIRMLISIGVIAAISLLLAVGYNNSNINMSDNHIKSQCMTLQSQLYSMVKAGVPRDVDKIKANEGTKRVQTFTLPSNLQYLSFGVDPDKDNDGKLTTGLDEDGAVICYKIDGGSKKVIWLSQEKIRFREGYYNTNREEWTIKQSQNGGQEGFILTGHGESTLVFELISKNNEIFVLIQATDGYNLP